MGLTNWGLRSSLSIGFLIVGTSVAIAPLPATISISSAIAVAPDTSSPDTSESDTEALGITGFETYTLPTQFSIEIPSGWFVEGAELEGFALITSYRPDSEVPQPTDVKTEVTLVSEPPETYVDREIDALIQQEYVIDRFGIASVKGNEAFRVWIIEIPGDFANQVITFVGYENGRTAKIVSHYNDDSSTTKDTILQIHRSFDVISETE